MGAFQLFLEHIQKSEMNDLSWVNGPTEKAEGNSSHSGWLHESKLGHPLLFLIVMKYQSFKSQNLLE
jgi:hypothetical protein